MDFGFSEENERLRQKAVDWLTEHVTPEVLAEKKANAEYLRVFGGMLEEVMAYVGRRMRADLTVADIVWSIEALDVGLNLRSRSHPELVERVDAQGVRLAVLAAVGIIEVMTEPIPSRSTRKKQRASRTS